MNMVNDICCYGGVGVNTQLLVRVYCSGVDIHNPDCTGSILIGYGKHVVDSCILRSSADFPAAHV